MKKNIIFSIITVVLIAGCNDTKSDNNKEVSKQESKKVEPKVETVSKEEKKVVVKTQKKESRQINPERGQKLFAKKLKKACGVNGGQVAKKHTQDEWRAIEKSGKIKEEIKKICPKVSDDALKDKYLENYFDFFYNFANDSGNVPAC